MLRRLSHHLILLLAHRLLLSHGRLGTTGLRHQYLTLPIEVLLDISSEARQQGVQIHLCLVISHVHCALTRVVLQGNESLQQIAILRGEVLTR